MNVYEVNKGIYQNVPPMEEKPVKNVIYEFLHDHPSTYYLMLNHDIHYYTLFHVTSFHCEMVMKEIYSIISELGPVVDIINNQDTEMLEIWIKYDGEPMMFGLFDYTRGVVEV